MYYVPDGTKECGYYECKKCGNRFLSMQTMKRIPCPDCEAEIDYEIGPDESLEDVLDTAELIQKIEGEDAGEIGEKEHLKASEQYSYGADPVRDGVSTGKDMERQTLVSYSDIQSLPDLTCFWRAF